MELQDALLKLDPQNDEHWTAEGLPALAAVEAIAGEKYDRQQVVDAAPEMNREYAREFFAPKEEPKEQSDDEAKSALELCLEQRGELSDALAEAVREKNAASKKVESLHSELSRLTAHIERITPHEDEQKQRMNHIKKMNEERIRKGKLRAELAKSGVSELMKDVGPSKLDQAMARRPKRGQNRPGKV